MGRVSEREQEIRLFVIVKNKLMSVFNASVACEQALYLGLTQDLFWARAASGRERIEAGAS